MLNYSCLRCLSLEEIAIVREVISGLQVEELVVEELIEKEKSDAAVPAVPPLLEVRLEVLPVRLVHRLVRHVTATTALLELPENRTQDAKLALIYVQNCIDYLAHASG